MTDEEYRAKLRFELLSQMRSEDARAERKRLREGEEFRERIRSLIEHQRPFWFWFAILVAMAIASKAVK